ncbi:hypothetical protein [Nonomuraea turcica]|uniref:hypothetical protein n=1 Tax=Nonomuraea sp. G32 TaxID=3067274 RepID=UPI00273C1171|nr:hypothetical protein [Nonomuraea sp. G32]MDP4505501.1 hypothetical protein [Nonomuraea sp. G32]
MHQPSQLVAIDALASYIRTVRYLVVRRPDMSYRQQLVRFAMAPFSSVPVTKGD